VQAKWLLIALCRFCLVRGFPAGGSVANRNLAVRADIADVEGALRRDDLLIVRFEKATCLPSLQPSAATSTSTTPDTRAWQSAAGPGSVFSRLAKVRRSSMLNYKQGPNTAAAICYLTRAISVVRASRVRWWYKARVPGGGGRQASQ
jgi:hypothetical protein